MEFAALGDAYEWQSALQRHFVPVAGLYPSQGGFLIGRLNSAESVFVFYAEMISEPAVAFLL